MGVLSPALTSGQYLNFMHFTDTGFSFNLSMGDSALVSSVSYTTSDVLQHKWRASLKTILLLYE